MPDNSMSKDVLPLIESVSKLVGGDHVFRDPDSIASYSSDTFSRAAVDFAFVVRPGSVDELAAAVGMITAAGCAVIPRGAGLSYTGGYTPIEGGSVAIDLTRLDKVVEINTTDMYATVECGCTWNTLYQALREKGLRTPFLGPLSGATTTIGGGLAQGSTFFGSTQYGTSADSILGLEVVLADGAVLKTGSGANRHNGAPFFRNYGPDLTGVFLNDTGAFGIKARATFRLIPFARFTGHASFAYPTMADMSAALSEVGRSGLAAECAGHDPRMQHMRTQQVSLLADLRILRGVIRSAPSLLSGLASAARMALKGRRALNGGGYTMHINVDATSAAGLALTMQEIARIGQAKGVPIEPTVPKGMRAGPFNRVIDGAVIAPEGQRMLPINCGVPHSRVMEAIGKIDKFLAQNDALVKAHGIEWGYVLLAVSTTAVLIDLLVFWRDPPPARKQTYADWFHAPDMAPATQAVKQLREGLVQIFLELGAVHVQIGKLYPYRDALELETLNFVQAIKRQVDPNHLMNPGSLGL